MIVEQDERLQLEATDQGIGFCRISFGRAQVCAAVVMLQQHRAGAVTG